MDNTTLASRTLDYSLLCDGLTYYVNGFAARDKLSEDKVRFELEKLSRRVIDIIIAYPPEKPDVVTPCWHLEYRGAIKKLLKEKGVVDGFIGFHEAFGIQPSPGIGVDLLRITTTVGMVAGLLLSDLDPAGAEFSFWV